ncbi:myb-related transcription factor, partner of profilin-like [Thalassophryne amazonica]|uniref:myb-related transcription factor, partner of profilin-like n=1 Tax=Thalassophryne amazonica TaxID=390379 RepID=UPI0014713ECB|nr:myb-related transcription factor, partner of profilin-like [Thalassophryne amazonica]
MNNSEQQKERKARRKPFSCSDGSKRQKQKGTLIKAQRGQISFKMEERLIVAVNTRPELYDSSNYDYRDKYKKDIAWRRVSEETGLEEEVCRKRWKGLRDTYLRERRMETEARKSGAAAHQRRRWRFSGALSFLDPFVAPRPTTSNMGQVQQPQEAQNQDLPPSSTVDQESEEDDEEPRTSSLSEVSSGSNDPGPSGAAAPTPPVSTPTGQRKRRRTRSQEEPSVVEAAILAALNRPPPPPPPPPPREFNAVEHFLLSLAPALERLPFHEQEIVKMEIHKVILDHCTVVLNLEHSAPQ